MASLTQSDDKKHDIVATFSHKNAVDINNRTIKIFMHSHLD